MKRFSRVFARRLGALLAAGAFVVAGCEGPEGPEGPQGPAGQDGTDGTNGTDGTDGPQGPSGPSGPIGPTGPGGPTGPTGPQGEGTAIDPNVGLSSLVALSFWDDASGAVDIPDYVRLRTEQLAKGTLPMFVQFPLKAAATDTLRAVWGLKPNVVIRWLDPITWAEGPTAPRLGANADYTAYFGDGWDADWGAGGVIGSAPQWNGSGSAGFMWINHEYVSGNPPTATSAPTNSNLVLAKFLRFHKLLSNDVAASIWAQPDLDKFIEQSKKQVGGSWIRIVQDAATLEWTVDRSAKNLRYDATSGTQVKITGTAIASGASVDDAGAALPAGVAPGITGDCSGGQTPWGTVISAEENVQDYYGDLEACWSSSMQFLVGKGCDPGAAITYTTAASASSEWGRHSLAAQRKAKDLYGYLVEIDPGQAPGEYLGKTTAGVGHRKLGHMGRARWENATIVTDASWKLVPGKPIVIYSGDDRRSGRIYKWVSAQPYTAGMTRTQVRDLLDTGTLYVAHFAGLDNATGETLVGGGVPTNAPGQWIELSVGSTDTPPNAAALASSKKVGEALQDNAYNGLGGFASDDAVRAGLFTASNKLGIMELNRPEDLEYNPLDGKIYVAFTNNNQRTALDQGGKLFDPAMQPMVAPKRADTTGSMFAITEVGDPATTKSFTYSRVWKGSKGTGAFDAANIDNIMIDRDGGVWFGTDGNFGTASHADAIYYLDQDPAHAAGQPGIVNPTFGKALRVAAVPSDAEASGPSFASDGRTLFMAVQHPGEGVFSAWPPR